MAFDHGAVTHRAGFAAITRAVGLGDQRRGWARILVTGVFVAAGLLPGLAGAVDLIGITQPAALDQPQINVLLRSSENGPPIIGETLNFISLLNGGNESLTTITLAGYLDTGASGILLSTSVERGWNLAPATGTGGQPVIYSDVGVAGTSDFNVSQPLHINLAPYEPAINANLQYASDYTTQDPSVFTQKITGAPVRAQLGPILPDLDTLPDDITADPQTAELAFLFQDLNVIGMPALKGKVMVIDARSTNHTAQTLQQNGGDLSALFIDLDSFFLRTYIYNPNTPFNAAKAYTDPTIKSDPGIPKTNLHVKLSYGSFDRFTTVTPAGSSGPILEHNPFIGPDPVRQLAANPSSLPLDNTPGIKIGFSYTDPTGGPHLVESSAEGSFLLDTGAGASIISQNLASQLHIRYTAGTFGGDEPELEVFNPTTSATIIDSLHFPQFRLSVGGIGGTTVVQGFFLDSLLIRTMEGNPANDNDPRHLAFYGAPVLVSDITVKDPVTQQSLTLDGILGMNFLVASLNLDTTTLAVDGFTPGAFDWITFDEPNGILGLSLNSSFHIAGDFNLDGKLTNADLQGMLNAFKDVSAFEAAHSLNANAWGDLADVNRDGAVNMADFKALMDVLSGAAGGSGGQSAVPEPAGWVLAALGCAWMLAGRNRARSRTAGRWPSR